jgi:polyvinyl alcohol dehydrogenase (cytochrome)
MQPSQDIAVRFGLALVLFLASCSAPKRDSTSASPATPVGGSNATAGSTATAVPQTAGASGGTRTGQAQPQADGGRSPMQGIAPDADGGPGQPNTAGSDTVDWPSFSKNGDNTRYASQEKLIAEDNVAKLVRKWTWTEAAVTGTPAVVEGIVYFGDWKGSVHALAAVDGKVVWSTALQTGGGSSQLNDSALVTADTVYIGGSGAQLFAVDRKTGKKLWDPPITLDKQDKTMLWSSPTLAGNLVVTGIGSYAVFLGGAFRGSIVAVDAQTGAARWQTYVVPESGQGVSVWSSAAYDDTRKRLYIGTGQTYKLPASPNSDAVVSIDRDSGMLVWTHQYTADDAFSLTSATSGHDFDVGAAPNLFVDNGRALVGAGDKGGRYLALDRDTGAMVWSQTLTPGGRNGGVMGTAAYAQGVIYVTSNTGEPTSLAGAGGPPASTAFALSAATGDILWKTPLSDGSFGGVTVANGVVFATTIDGMLYALRAKDGHILWMDKMGGSAAGGISIVDGMIYVGNGWEWTPSGSLKGGLIAYGLP